MPPRVGLCGVLAASRPRLRLAPPIPYAAPPTNTPLMLWKSIFLALTLCLSWQKQALSQKKFSFANASLEGRQNEGTAPPFWDNCGKNSTPDVLPGPWGVMTPAHEGQSYVGLVTREDGTWEAMSQKLPQDLRKDYCYRFTVHLAQAEYAGYNKKPAVLRIWGGSGPCKREQLLATSPPIKHEDWQAYELSFTAKENWSHVIIEAYYDGGSLFYYRGNILLDALSDFEACIRA